MSLPLIMPSFVMDAVVIHGSKDPRARCQVLSLWLPMRKDLTLVPREPWKTIYIHVPEANKA